MSTKELSPSRIVQNPRLWPSSFSQPVTSQQTCIRTYIFKDGTKVEKFLNFVNKTFPNRKVDIKQQNDGSTSISLTTTSQLQVKNYSFSDKSICESICYNAYCSNGTECKNRPAYTLYNVCLYSCQNYRFNLL